MSKINLNADAHLHINVSGEEKIKKLKNDIDGLNRTLSQTESDLQNANDEIWRLTEELEDLKDSDVGILKDKLEGFERTARRGAAEVERMLRALKLDEAIGDSDYVIKTLNSVRNGAMTVGQAISNIKAEFKYLFEENYNNNGGLFDAQMVTSFAASLEMVSQQLDSVSKKVTAILENGVPAVGGGGTSGISGTAEVLNEIRIAVEGMSEESRAAYEPITQLLVKLTEYANLDSTKLLGVSQAFRNIADVGGGTFSDKKIENITNLLHLLESSDGSKLSSIRFDINGVNDLHVSKASLRNLAEYLPQIQKVNAARLKELGDVNLTNFNNVKVSKASMEAIAQLNEALKSIKETRVAIASENSGGIDIDAAGSSNSSGKDVITFYQQISKSIKDYFQALTQAQKQVQDLRLSSDGAKWESDERQAEIDNLNRLRDIYEKYANEKIRAQMSDAEQVKIAQLEVDLSNKLATAIERRVMAEERAGGSRYKEEVAAFEQSEREREEVIERSNEKLFQAHVEASKRAKQLYKEEVAAFEQSEREREEVIERSNEKLFQAHVEASKRRRQQETADLNAAWKSQGLTSSNIDSLFSKANKNQGLFKDVDGGFNAIRDKYQQLIQLQEQWKAGGSNATAPEVESITKLRKELKGLVEERLADTKAAKQREVETKKQTAAETKRQSLLKQMYNLLTRLKKEEENWSAAKNGKSSGAYSNLQQYQQKLGDLIHAAETIKTPEGIENISSQFAVLTKSAAESEHVIRANGEAVQTWRDRLGGLADKFTSWFGITRVIMAAVNAVRKMIASAKEIDSALTQLKIVTNATNEEMEAFANTAIDLAHNLGKSVTELTKSIETFSRLGYSLNDAAELAKYATIMSNVAGVSTEEATTGLTSIIKGYDKDVEDAEHVADILVTVGQEYAVSAAEMMEAYEKSGAALHATNTSLEKSAGLIAAANASVQDASVIGTAIKTVSARIRGSKTDLEELGESTDDLAEGFSKYADEIKALTGFDIMIDKTHFKDIYDIFEGMAGSWDKLSDTQQARISEILGGTRQLQVISSIIGNWKDAVGAYETAINSAGASTKANEIYMQSIEARMNQLKATFESLSKTILDSGAMHTVVNTLNWLLERFTGLVKTTGALPPILATIMGYLSATKNFGRAKMLALKQNMPKAIIVPLGYGRFRYCGCCDTAA